MTITSQLRCLLALADQRYPDQAGLVCGHSSAELTQAVASLEVELGYSIFQSGLPFGTLTPEGVQILAWARRHVTECDELQADLKAMQSEGPIAQLLARRSVSPNRLQAPGPDAQGIELIVQAALRAPDHGGLHPWRLIEFREEQRKELADRFEQEKLRRDPLASNIDRRRARAHATRPPVLLGFVVTPRKRDKVPIREQWLAAGAALGNLLNAAHQLGFGAIVLSGDRCFDPVMGAQLDVPPSEYLVGFISIGSVLQVPPARRAVSPGEVWSCWSPSLGTTDAGRDPVDEPSNGGFPD